VNVTVVSSAADTPGVYHISLDWSIG